MPYSLLLCDENHAVLLWDGYSWQGLPYKPSCSVPLILLCFLLCLASGITMLAGVGQCVLYWYPIAKTLCSKVSLPASCRCKCEDRTFITGHFQLLGSFAIVCGLSSAKCACMQKPPCNTDSNSSDRQKALCFTCLTQFMAQEETVYFPSPCKNPSVVFSYLFSVAHLNKSVFSSLSSAMFISLVAKQKACLRLLGLAAAGLCLLLFCWWGEVLVGFF